MTCIHAWSDWSEKRECPLVRYLDRQLENLGGCSMKVSRGDTSQSSVWQFRRVVAFILGCLLVNGALFAFIFRHWKVEQILSSLDSEEDLFNLRGQEIGESWGVQSPARILLEETRVVIQAAGGVPGSHLSTAQRKAWDAAHPCAGRQQLVPLWNKEKRSPTVTNKTDASRKPSILLHALFEEYANLHRTCTHGGDLEYVTELYKSGNESSGPCKFLVVEFGAYGVGNRLLWLVSAYLYALLTKRVLLMDTRSTVHNLLCQPFPGSSWHLPSNFPYSSEARWPMPAKFQEEWDGWENKGAIGDFSVPKKTVEDMNREQEGLRDIDMHQIAKEKRDTMAAIMAKIHSDRLSHIDKEQIRSMVGRRLTEEDEPGNVPPNFYKVQANDGWSPNPRFFCGNEQAHLHLVKWVSLNSGCLYFLPDLFAMPSFQPALEELFPDRNPLTHLVRHLTLPVDSIWTTVRNLFNSDFKSAKKVVGMQLRYRDGPAMYKLLNDKVNQRVSQCAQDHGLIPDPAANSPTAWSIHEAPVLIYIASLYPGLQDHLGSVYEEMMKRRRNPAVKLLQLSKFGFQSFDPLADNQAFTEIICLSLSDELMTSPQSTYGQIAQAYGGLTPWLIDFKIQATSNCVQGQSTDACYQMPIAKFTCPFNKEVDGMAMADVAPYLKPCQDTDGLQLVPP